MIPLNGCHLRTGFDVYCEKAHMDQMKTSIEILLSVSFCIIIHVCIFVVENYVHQCNMDVIQA